MQAPKNFDWDVPYFGVLALVALFAALSAVNNSLTRADNSLFTYAAMPIFTYIVLSVVAFAALFLLFLIVILMVIQEYIFKDGIVIAILGLIPLGVILFFVWVSMGFTVGLYNQFDPATRDSLLSPLGLIALTISLSQLVMSPQVELEVFAAGSQKLKLLGLKTLVNRLFSAALPGIFVLFVFSFLLMLSGLKPEDGGFRLFGSIIIACFVADMLPKKVNDALKGLELILLPVLLIGASYLVSFVLVFAKQGWTSGQLLAFALTVIYALFVYMKSKKIPAWYFSEHPSFHLSSAGPPGAKFEVWRDRLSSEDRDKISYAKPGETLSIVVDGKRYRVEKTDTDVLVYDEIND